MIESHFVENYFNYYSQNVLVCFFKPLDEFDNYTVSE